jgi:hypothetical protein
MKEPLDDYIADDKSGIQRRLGEVVNWLPIRRQSEAKEESQNEAAETPLSDSPYRSQLEDGAEHEDLGP